MASLEMDGPYDLDNETIDANVTRTSAGNYALERIVKEGSFIVNYVGRSDDDVRGRLKYWVGRKSYYKRFKFSYAPLVKAAFEKECKNYHDFSGSEKLDNEIHPQRPESTDWGCPYCDYKSLIKEEKMNEKTICILCEKNAEILGAQGKDGYFTKCEICGEYFLASPELFEGSYTAMPREKRTMISSYTRDRFEQREEPPQLEDSGYLKAIITEYENKTLDNKLENLIWYIRKKSPQHGDSVLLEAEKDYPITYSLSPEGFKEILNNAIAQKLIESTESGFELTEKGWTMGTELMESKEGSEP